MVITDSYTTGSATCLNYSGGIVGRNAMTLTIDTSYATGTMTGAPSNGITDAGTVNNSYYNSDNTPASATGTGLTTLQMQSAINFTGFTFDATHWVMGTGSYPFPILYWQ